MARTRNERNAIFSVRDCFLASMRAQAARPSMLHFYLTPIRRLRETIRSRLCSSTCNLKVKQAMYAVSWVLVDECFRRLGKIPVKLLAIMLGTCKP